MSGSRRRFTAECKIEAAHRVVNSGRSIAQVARDLPLNEVTLGNWVREERRRLDALAGTHAEPLSATERAELLRLRKQVAEQEKDRRSWGRRPRTSPRIHRSRAVCVDGCGVCELRDHPDGPPARGPRPATTGGSTRRTAARRPRLLPNAGPTSTR